MSADSISVDTIRLIGAESPLAQDQGRYEIVDPNLGFQFSQSADIVTLSNVGAIGGAQIQGLLYVPDLISQDCIDQEKNILPPNITRRNQLPPSNLPVVGLAPWFAPDCVEEYLKSANTAKTRSFVFYLPDNSTSSPPQASDSAWKLDDQGQWKQNYSFPVYAIAGMRGTILTRKLAQYSGNITELPFGQELAKSFGNDTYVRLLATVTIESRNTLPSLWVFLLVVLGILIFVIASTSIVMHILQRRRRRDLRNRVVNGEVDLEVLGIKRLTVPQEILDKMPLYTFTANTDQEGQTLQAPTPAHIGGDQSPNTASANLRSSIPAFSQPTCAICLDDFVASSTTVRELPCRHIFHPDCVDTFLLNNSSLCPICKNSVLPKGYCPAVITNAMVRRERMLSRIRERGGDIPPSRMDRMLWRHGTQSYERTRNRQLYGQAFAELVFGRRNGNRGQQTEASENDVEMGPATPQTSQPPLQNTQNNTAQTNATGALVGDTVSPALPDSHNDICPPPGPGTTGQARREWARQRALAMLRSRRTPAEVELDNEEERGQNKWWKRWFKRS